jgi:peptide-methionine (R)-S-oxide reductase
MATLSQGGGHGHSEGTGLMGEERVERGEREKEIPSSEEEWRRRLSPEQFEVLRNKGTERAYTGKYAFTKDRGVYRCAACGAELFRSEAKYDSGTGWPSFFEPIARGSVELHEDRSFGMRRTEVTCARCGGHLGHLFDDGPRPTGERYCMNSISLDLEPDDEPRPRAEGP